MIVVIVELNIPQDSIVCTNLNTHTILYLAAVFTQDVGVLGSVDDASPPGGVDCETLTPLW